MSNSTKRLRERQQDAHNSASPLPKKSKTSHVPAKKSGLEDLVDDNAREGKKLGAKLTNGVSQSRASAVDDSHAVVAQDSAEGSTGEDVDEAKGLKAQQKRATAQKGAVGKKSKVSQQPEGPEKQKGKADAVIINISSGESSSELPEDDEEVEEDGPATATQAETLTNGHIAGDDQNEPVRDGAEDTEMQDADNNAADQADEPTFGDLLQARHPEPIDVQMSLADANTDPHGVVPASGDPRLPSGHSLGTLLTQALRNNDRDLLETCFAMTDPKGIRATIQRQRPQEVIVLLERIADRIHRAPGRAGNLMVWIQWSLVTHGGYLANQAELMKKLKAVYQVVRERASGLQPLLHLKGKLDMLSAQLETRRNLQMESQQVNLENLDDPSGVLYVEGQDEDTSGSDDEEEDAAPGSSRPQKRKGKVQRNGGLGDGEIDSGLPNGVSHNEDLDASDDDDEDDEDDDPNELIDVEAEESIDEDEERSEDDAGSSADEEEEEFDEEEESDDDSNANPPPKPSNLVRKR